MWLGAFEPSALARAARRAVDGDLFARRRARATARRRGHAPRARALPGRRALPVPLGPGEGRSRVDGQLARGARAAARHRASPSTPPALPLDYKLRRLAPASAILKRVARRAACRATIVRSPEEGLRHADRRAGCAASCARWRATRCSTRRSLAADRRARRAARSSACSTSTRAARRSPPAPVGAAGARAVAAEEPGRATATSAADRRRASTR